MLGQVLQPYTQRSECDLTETPALGLFSAAYSEHIQWLHEICPFAMALGYFGHTETSRRSSPQTGVARKAVLCIYQLQVSYYWVLPLIAVSRFRGWTGGGGGFLLSKLRSAWAVAFPKSSSYRNCELTWKISPCSTRVDDIANTFRIS